MADPLTIIADICHDQPHDALEQIACALGFTQDKEPRFAAVATRVKRSGGPKKITVHVPEDSPLWELPAGTVTRLFLIPPGVKASDQKTFRKP